MKKNILWSALSILLILNGCGSQKLIVRNDPDFDTQIWLSRKTAIFPAFLNSSIYLKQEKVDSTLEPLLREKSKTYMYFIPSQEVVQAMTDNQLQEEYKNIAATYDKEKKLDLPKIKEIGNKLGYDSIFLIKAIQDNSTYEKIDNETKRKKIYSTILEAIIIDVHSGKILFQAKSRGVYNDENFYINLPDIHNPTKITITTGFSKQFALAYVNAFEKIINQLNNKFSGECQEGDCLDGTGTLMFYDRPYNKGRLLQNVTQYSGEWRDGHAHGNGTMYEKEGNITIKYEGIWEKGELKKELQLYLLQNDAWTPITPQDLAKIIENQKK